MYYIFFIIFIVFALNIYGYKRLLTEMKEYLELENEVKEYLLIKRKMNKLRNSQDKINVILDKGLERLRELKLRNLKNRKLLENS